MGAWLIKILFFFSDIDKYSRGYDYAYKWDQEARLSLMIVSYLAITVNISFQISNNYF